MSLNPSASAFFPYHPVTGQMLRQQPPSTQGQSPLQQPQQIYGGYVHPIPQAAPRQLNPVHPQPPHFVDPTSIATNVSLPVFVTPTLTPLQTAIAPPTPTFQLTPGGPSSPSIPNAMTNMPHLVLQPFYPTPSPRTGIAPLITSPLVGGIPSTPGAIFGAPVTPQILSSPAFSTVAIASPSASHMPPQHKLDQLQLGAAVSHTSPRVHQTSFGGTSVVGSRTANFGGRQILNAGDGSSPQVTSSGPHAPDLSANETRSRKSNPGQRGKESQASQEGVKKTEPTLPPPMLTGDDSSMPRSAQIQPQFMTTFTPPLVPMSVPIPVGSFMQPAGQYMMFAPPTAEAIVQAQAQIQQQAVATAQAQQAVHMANVANGMMAQQMLNANGGLPHSTSAPTTAAMPKQFSSELMRQYSASDAEMQRKRIDAEAVMSDLVINVKSKIPEDKRNIPREVVWLVGPPSSGRSTLARYVCQLRGFTVNGEHATIDMDNVWRIISERNHQEQIQANNPFEEALTLLESILKSQSTNGLVIDGYLTKECHVGYVKDMFNYFRSVRPTVRFAFVLLNCTEDQITNRWRTKHNIPRNIRRSQQKSKELATWRRTFQSGQENYQAVRHALCSEYDITPINADHNLRAVQRDLESELMRRRHGDLRNESREPPPPTSSTFQRFSQTSYPTVHSQMSESGYRVRHPSHAPHIQHSHETHSHSHTHPHQQHNRRYNRSGNTGGTTPTSSIGSSPSRGDRHGRFKVQRSITHTVMAKITTRVRQRVIEMIYPRVPRHDSRSNNLFHRLPAKFPVTMSQIRLDQIKRNDYWVSEKTDGVRYLMYIEKQHGQRRSERRRARTHDEDAAVEEFNCYLIDRKFFICRVCGDLYISGQDNDALLDGEFVTIEDENGEEKPIFIVFDAVQVSHLNIAKNAYSIRHEHIRNLVDRIPLEQNELFPLRITYKPLIEASRLQNVMSQIRYDDRRHKYVHHSDSGLVTLNDGLMFMPEHSPYLPSEHDLPVVKWKWKELNTVDLMINFRELGKYQSHKQLILYCQGDGSSVAEFQNKRLPAEHCQVLDELLRKARSIGPKRQNGKRKQQDLHSCIVECVWDPEYGMWCPKWLRMDKETPNYIKVAKAIDRDLAEFISPETLVTTLSREEVSEAVRNLGQRTS